uniref:Uncharacterized protein n=1 Tax=Tanacetum cinerariifolium TaxID=118510 RepID=A0A6L2M133_TANCI|nr:hypothetical protein [Tanacetum cinerariifolium]
MTAGLRDRPPMLSTGRYPQWHSRFLGYIDTRPNGEALRKCILSGPYKPTTVLVQAVAATDVSLANPGHTTVETPMNMSPANKAHFEAKKEAIHLILTGIGDEIYLTPHKSYAPSSKPSIPTRSHTTAIHKGKEIAKPITPPSEIAFEKDTDPEQVQRDKDMQKNLALIAKYFKKIYKPTNNNLITSLNSRNKNVDMTSWYKNDNHSGQFGNQRTMNVVGARENVGSPERMLLCKQAEQGVPLQAEQYDWLADTDEEIDEQELEARYSYMEKNQEVPTADSGIDSDNTCLVEMDDSNVILDSSDMCNDDIQNDQNDVESDDERVALANLIANLKLDIDENKKFQKQLKKKTQHLLRN